MCLSLGWKLDTLYPSLLLRIFNVKSLSIFIKLELFLNNNNLLRNVF